MDTTTNANLPTNYYYRWWGGCWGGGEKAKVEQWAKEIAVSTLIIFFIILVYRAMYYFNSYEDLVNYILWQWLGWFAIYACILVAGCTRKPGWYLPFLAISRIYLHYLLPCTVLITLLANFQCVVEGSAPGPQKLLTINVKINYSVDQYIAGRLSFVVDTLSISSIAMLVLDAGALAFIRHVVRHAYKHMKESNRKEKANTELIV